MARRKRFSSSSVPPSPKQALFDEAVLTAFPPRRAPTPMQGDARSSPDDGPNSERVAGRDTLRSDPTNNAPGTNNGGGGAEGDHPAADKPKINPAVVEYFAFIGCPAEEIAAQLDCQVEHLRAHLPIIERGRLRGNVFLRKQLMAATMRGEFPALRFQANNRLGMSDNPAAARLQALQAEALQLDLDLEKGQRSRSELDSIPEEEIEARTQKIRAEIQRLEAEQGILPKPKLKPNGSEGNNENGGPAN